MSETENQSASSHLAAWPFYDRVDLDGMWLTALATTFKGGALTSSSGELLIRY
jgi:hypothetical protein